MTATEPTTAELTQAHVWLDQVVEAAKAERDRIRGVLADRARDQHAQGVAPSWRVQDVATVSARISRDATEVADPDTLAQWVTQRHPTETVTAVTVRPAFLTWLLKNARPAGDGTVCDPDGEPIPGLRHVPGGAFLGITVGQVSQAAKELFGAYALEGLHAAATLAGPAIVGPLAELVAAEPVGHLDPGEAAA